MIISKTLLKTCFFILGLIFLSSVVFPKTALAERENIAVLEFRGSNLEAAQENLLPIFTDRVRESVLMLLDKQKFQLYTKENMELFLDNIDIDPGCITTTCEVKIGREIQADYVISGNVIFAESKYFVSIKIHSSKDGTPLSIINMEENEISDIFSRLDSAMKSVLFKADLLHTERSPQEYPLTEKKKPFSFNVGGATALALGSIGALYTYNEGMNPNISQGTLIGYNIANIACWGVALGGGFYMFKGTF